MNAAEQREKNDLEARQDMARYAGDPVNLTFWRIIVGALGIGLLIITLKFTRDATRVASRAAEATESAVEVTSNTSRRQLRAFVFEKGFEKVISICNETIRDYIFFLKWENTGLTPATDVQSWVKL